MSNQTSGIRVNAAKEWAYYERLPPKLRRIVSRAPYDYAVEFLWQESKRRPEDAVIADFASKIFSDRDDELRRVYGPDHPMIGQRSGSKI